MVPKIPDALSSMLTTPSAHSLTLLTNVLGTTSNWLFLRYLLAILDERQGQSSADVAVIFVSWLKPPSFWVAEAKRVLGLDLSKKEVTGNLIFIDALSSLFLPSTNSSERNTPQHTLLRSSDLVEFSKAFATSVNALKTRVPSPVERVVLMLDTPSIVLQTSSPTISGSELLRTLTELRSEVDSMIVAMPANEPLLSLQATHTSTPLERENASVLVGLAHQSDVLIGCRLLETGWANDVSGIVRITKGGAGMEDDDEIKAPRAEAISPDGEWLYHISGDGSVNVWSRGSGS